MNTNAWCCRLCSLLLLAPAASSQAVIYFNEDFSYPDGALTAVSGGNWTTHSGTVGEIQVASGMIKLNDIQTEDVNRSTGGSLTSGVIYGAFDFSVTATIPVGGSDFEYFAHFGNGTGDFVSRVDVVAATAGDFSLGIAGNSGTAEATWGTDLVFGTTYRAMVRYNRDTGISTLWVDPVDESSVSIDSLADSNDVEGFYFRESASSANETITVDNLIVASSFAEALTGVPEPSSLGLLAACSLLGLRRRR